VAAASAHVWIAWPLAVASLYFFGHVAGRLLVAPREGRTPLSWAVIRVVAGLLLSTIAFFLSLVLALSWIVGPLAVAGIALACHRRRALQVAIPSMPAPSTAAGVLVGALLLSPVVISSLRMAPGAFPPVFYNVDNAYFLEQVHSLTRTATYPPESLSNFGGRRAYHFATHGMAALVSRTSGLPAHAATYGIVLPLLTAGVLAAAVQAARQIAPGLAPALTVPLLLLPFPSFWYPFADALIPLLKAALEGPVSPVVSAIGDNVELWGTASNVGQNVGAQFLVLASVGGLVGAPAYGWRLPVFLAGTGILVKVSAGAAIVAGLLMACGYRALRQRHLRPAAPALAVAALCAATFGVFWLLPRLPPEFSIEPFPLFHLQRMRERGRLMGVPIDLVWLLAPALVVAVGGLRDPERRSMPLLIAALAPFVLVNATRSIDARPGGGGATDDWLQILLPVPILVHAFAASVASARWSRMGALARAAFVAVAALSVVPAAWVATRYAGILLVHPERGHEFVDNRAIAEALAAVPRDRTLIVTNDLRYPAQGFSRENRQMQIPAVFGHQAFAVNYAYEVFAFSRERFALQPLLRSEQWAPTIVAAAREYDWTHFLVHKPFVHPAGIPLERIFESDRYAVYRFGDR
jgi:hypothetical protein